MDLVGARLRTRRYLDRENDTTLFVDAEIDDELKTAQHVVWRLVGDRSSVWTSETTAISSNSAGVVDLSSIKPLRLISIAITAGGISRWMVQPSRLVDGKTNCPAIQTLRIGYVPRPVFPSGGAFLWGPGASGAGFDTELLDRLLCLLAAAALRVKLGERNPVLEAELAAARAEVLSILNVPRMSQIPLDQAMRKQRSPWWYVITAPDTLQLVV